MIRVRKRHRGLSSDHFELLPIENPAVLEIVRSDQNETIVAIHSLPSSAQSVNIDLARWQALSGHDLISGSAFDRLAELNLNPYEYVLLLIDHK